MAGRQREAAVAVWHDFIRQAAETQAADEAVARARQAKPNGQDRDWRGLELVDFADMHALLNTRPLIKGVLEHEQISLTVGDTGTGKTFLGLDRALHIALGR